MSLKITVTKVLDVDRKTPDREVIDLILKDIKNFLQDADLKVSRGFGGRPRGIKNKPKEDQSDNVVELTNEVQ